MNYEKIQIPFVRLGNIKQKAELFRQKFWDRSIPVDVENILEIKLKMDIIPVPDFRKRCDTDALITSDWAQIYVDYDMYMDERNKNRLRFSYAHEIGHLVLHKNIYENLDINASEDFYKFYSEISNKEYGKIETQANMFASLLLIPRETLFQSRKKILGYLAKNEILSIDKIERETLNAYLAIDLAKEFGVSEDAMRYALNNENNNN